jgi:threonine synthase
MLDARGRDYFCRCGAPLLARYDLDRARSWSREVLKDREPSMWRYREMLPLFDGEAPVTLGEGFTPLIHARALGARLGLDRLHQGRVAQSTNSFKARGQSTAITQRVRSARRSVGAVRGECGQRDGRVCGAGRTRGASLSAERRQATVRKVPVTART